MALLEFCYYLVYRVFRLVPRKGVSNHHLASSFFSILFSTNILTILLLLKFLDVRVNVLDEQIFKIMLLLVFAICYFSFRWYFIKKDKYREIIGVNDKKFKSHSLFIIVMGISYVIFTFLVFWILAVC